MIVSPAIGVKPLKKQTAEKQAITDQFNRRIVVITEVVERETRRSQEVIKQFMTHMPLPAWIMTAEGAVVFSNDLYHQGVSCSLLKEGLPCQKREGQSCADVPSSLAHVVNSTEVWRTHVKEVCEKRVVKDARLRLGVCGLWRAIFFPIELSNGDNLVGVVAMDLTAMTREQARSRAYNESIKELTARMHQVREAERADVARDIHDQLGQELSLLRFTVRRLKRGIMLNDLEVTQETVSKLESQISSVSASARRIALNLRPETLYNLGLVAATEQLVSDFRQSMGIRGVFEADPAELAEVEPTMALHLYRSAQELLNNVSRHASASRFSLELKRTESEYLLRVTDNGQGIPPERQFSGRLGLLGLRERAALFSGNILVETRPVFEGTRITVKFAYEAVPAAKLLPIRINFEDRRRA